uniref:eukaryotic translation initiation factor 5B-like isoform X2 n=1 Tax=Myxine glutinosa TaxID=7769 RepID=UPI00358E32CC
MGKRQKGKAEEDGACKVDDVDTDMPVAVMEDSSMTNSKKSAPGKKGKKKKGKNEYDEEDILREMEELAIENHNFGGASRKEEVKLVSSQDGQQSDEECFGRKTKQKMGKKKDCEEGMVEKNAISDGKNNNMENKRKQILSGDDKDSAHDKKEKGVKGGISSNKGDSSDEDTLKKGNLKQRRLLSDEEDISCMLQVKKKKSGKKINSTEELTRRKQVVAESEPDSECEKKIKKGKKAKNKKDNKLDSDDELPREKDEIKDSEAESEDDTEKTGMKTNRKQDQKLLEGSDEVSTVKTPAQKKAEKKERERKKREEERLKMKQKKEQEATKEVKLEKQIVKEVDISIPTEELNEELGDAKGAVLQKTDNGAEKDAEGDDAKKKKKKKAEKEEKPEKKKGPSKAMVKAMQEALAKRREEEERLKQEEEERLRRIEEAEALFLEKERLEQERKERKKQKEKERKERLKKEGKLLTPSQRQAKARAEATLRALQAQGIEIPSKETVQKRKSMIDDRRRKQKRQSRDTQSSLDMAQELQVQQSGESMPLEGTIANEVVADEKVVEEEDEVEEEEEGEAEKEEEGIADWEMIASDEENLKEDKQTTKTTERHGVLKRVVEQVESDAGKEETEIYSDDEDNDDVDAEEGEGEQEDEESESSDSDFGNERTKEQREYNVAKKRIEKRQAQNASRVTTDNLRAPVICVLGHVDTGKTKLLDKLRHTNVQDGEAGGITQQIGATNVPLDAIKEQTKMVKDFSRDKIKLPGMLIIDTPGHESFSNLRNRGSSLCDIAILVVDIMHGLEPQTIESINLLKSKKCPFIIALNKIDRLYDWKRGSDSDITFTIKKQKKNTKDEFDSRVNAVIAQFAEQHMNAALFYENKDQRTFVSMVPTSAHTGDGIGNIIALLVELTQTLLAKHICFSEELLAQVMEVKAISGLGTTIDVILTNGCLHEGATIVVAGVDGPIVTQVRGLLMPQPLKELRVKNQYERCKELMAAQGVKIIAKDLEKTLAGLPLRVAYHDDEIAVLRDEVVNELKNTLNSIKLAEHGVYVQASTLGSLEALLEFLRMSRIPYAGINIGPVHKRDIMKASAMLEHDNQYAVILAFDVKVEREAQEMADYLGVKVFSADIIYHLFDAFMKYRADIKKQKQEEFRHIAVFPCKLRIIPQFVFKSRDPIVVGVNVEAGQLKAGTLLCVPSKGFIDIGVVGGIEINHKPVDVARKGQEVCVKIDAMSGETPKMYGRHFEATDFLVSKISRDSINALKDWFRDDMQKSDWQLILELKKTFSIL